MQSLKKGEVIVTNNSQTKSGFKYGVVHQWGNKKRKIPQRSFLPIKANGEIQKDIKEVIKNDTKDYIKAFLKKEAKQKAQPNKTSKTKALYHNHLKSK